MAIDVNLYVVGVVTDDQLARAEAFTRELLGPADNETELWYHRRDDGVELLSGERYFGPRTYMHRSWLVTYGQIRIVQAAFPGLPVHYGGDSSDDVAEVTEADLEALWRHWLRSSDEPELEGETPPSL